MPKSPAFSDLLPGVVAMMLLLAALHPARPPTASRPGWEEGGAGSWYGGGHNGRRTSSGEIFDQNAMTAAHPTCRSAAGCG